MLTDDEARSLALSLPDATEADHHGRPSYRVRNRIFATLREDRAMNVMPGEDRILAAVEQDPETCSKVYWGKRLAAVRVELEHAEPDVLEGLLVEAWLRKAPKRLVEASGLFA